jgi:hypothetical protein
MRLPLWRQTVIAELLCQAQYNQGRPAALSFSICPAPFVRTLHVAMIAVMPHL